MNTEIIEGNKLIAEFMGGELQDVFCDNIKQKPRFYFSNDHKSPLCGGRHSEDGDTLQYHSSWDWLMEACKKFDELIFEKTEDIEMYVSLCDETDNYVCCYNKEGAWKSLVKAIKWYNTIKQ